MLKYILKRLGLSLLILAGVSLIIYVLVRIQPGGDFVDRKYDPLLMQTDSIELREKVAQIKHLYGLDVSPFKGYLNWAGNVIRGNWGESFKYSVPVGTKIIDGVETTVTSSSVIDVIKSKMGVSFIIAFIAMILQFLIAIPLGIISAVKQYGVIDYTVTVLTMMGISLPSFFFGTLLLKIFAVDLKWFPFAGLTDPNSTLPVFIDKLHHLVLPIMVLVVLSIGGLMRYTRTNMLEVLNADYIRTARAKGLSEHTVIYKHAFRNTLIPLATMLAGILPGLFGGAMITEQIFSIDGIGKAAYVAVSQGDIPLVMAYNMFLSTLTVIGILLSDIMYVIVDPRVKLA